MLNSALKLTAIVKLMEMDLQSENSKIFENRLNS